MLSLLKTVILLKGIRSPHFQKLNTICTFFQSLNSTTLPGLISGQILFRGPSKRNVVGRYTRELGEDHRLHKCRARKRFQAGCAEESEAAKSSPQCYFLIWTRSKGSSAQRVPDALTQTTLQHHFLAHL
uniref:Uncharacterized protein n=1 Tax=Sphaerodactylus townsendi TaxID=933632 RepID=A0ACB8EQX4_9SAUR